MCSAMHFWANAAVADTEFGVVAAGLLNFRSEPRISDNVLDVLAAGTRVEVAGRKDGWLQVVHDGRSGYLRDLPKFVRVVSMQESNAGGEDAEKAIRESEKLQETMEASEEKLQEAIRKETSLLTALDEIDAGLNAARNRAKKTRSEISALEREMEKNRSLLEECEKKAGPLAEYAKRRLVAIYKMQRLGAVSIGASAESISQLFFRKKALEKIYEHDEAKRAQLSEEKDRLKRLALRMKAQKIEKKELEGLLGEQIAAMSKEREKRGKFLESVRREKTSVAAFLEGCREAATVLDEKIAALGLEKAALPKEKIDSEAQDFSKENFESLKGLLKMPVKGTIVGEFGQRVDRTLGVERFCSGVSFKADRGEPIRAVTDGTVLFAGWFKGYGNMLIIDHGEHYYTVYAYAQELFKAKGDPVESWEVVGTVGDSGPVAGSELYFEIRHHGKPVDPLEWIRTG